MSASSVRSKNFSYNLINDSNRKKSCVDSLKDINSDKSKDELFGEYSKAMFKNSGIKEDDPKMLTYFQEFIESANLEKTTNRDLNAVKALIDYKTNENENRMFHNFMINTYQLDSSQNLLKSFMSEFNKNNKFTDPFFNSLHGLKNEYSLVRISEHKNKNNHVNCVIDISSGYQEYCSKQGKIGDCYLLQLILSIWYRYPEKIVSKFLFTDKMLETGVIPIKFWCEINKEWRLIIIDDYLPIDSQLNFVGTSPTGIFNNQFWPCLLEKAFAKLLGSYMNIDASAGLCRCDGVRWDMPPLAYAMILGPVNSMLVFFPDTISDNFEVFEEFCKSHTNGDVLGLATRYGSQYDSSTGLAYYHAYGFIDMIKNVEDSGFTLVKVQNPWSSGGEWLGDWSDNSDLWNKYPHIRKRVNFISKDDGIFFIEKKDFYKCFSFHFKSKIISSVETNLNNNYHKYFKNSICWSTSNREIEFINDENNYWYEKHNGYIKFHFSFIKFDVNGFVEIHDNERDIILKIGENNVTCAENKIYNGNWSNIKFSGLKSYFELTKKLNNNSLIEHGKNLNKKNDLSNRKFTKDYDTFDSSNFYKGRELYNLKRYEDAIICYDKAINSEPMFINAYFNKGSCLSALKRYEEAIQCFTRCIELDPKISYFYYENGNAYYNLNNFQKALEWYEKTLEINPNDESALFSKKLAENYIVYQKIK